MYGSPWTRSGITGVRLPRLQVVHRQVLIYFDQPELITGPQHPSISASIQGDLDGHCEQDIYIFRDVKSLRRIEIISEPSATGEHSDRHLNWAVYLRFILRQGLGDFRKCVAQGGPCMSLVIAR